jgi:hypothetical protein
MGNTAIWLANKRMPFRFAAALYGQPALPNERNTSVRYGAISL